MELDGKLVVAIKEECGRCLTRFSGRVDSEFSLTFTPLKEPEADQEEEVELETAELGLIPYEAEQIDLFARIYPMNARPLQATAGRRILQSD